VLALHGLTPADLLVVELGGATLVLALIALAAGQLHFQGAGRAMAQGIVLPGLTWLLEILGLARTTATSGSLLLGMESLVVVVLAVLVLRERLGVAGGLALLLGSAGTALVLASDGVSPSIVGAQAAGNALVIAAVVCSAVYVVWSRRAARPVAEGLGVTAWQFAGSTLTVCPFVAISWASDGSRLASAKPAQLVAAVTVLACTVAAMAAFNRGISSVSAARAGFLLSLQPIAGAITATGVIGEPLRTPAVIGGALIVFGLLVLAQDQSREPG
jgi:drug/metabolite transporter (DMT)-like permease